jgi:agmatine deiminase
VQFVVKGEAQSGDREVAGIDWVFNAWGGLDGGLYKPWDDDDAVPKKLLGRLGLRRFESPIVLEGGSIHVDGEGRVLVHKPCSIHRSDPNPGCSQHQA